MTIMIRGVLTSRSTLSDRLPEDAYVLKSFIFSQYPDEWSFDTTEPLHGMLQMIDITCHSTGEPSREACIELPMYGT